jgi:hypothetical protein
LLAALAGWAARHPEAAAFCVLGVLVAALCVLAAIRVGGIFDEPGACYLEWDDGVGWLKARRFGPDRRLAPYVDARAGLDAARALGCEVRQ